MKALRIDQGGIEARLPCLPPIRLEPGVLVTLFVLTLPLWRGWQATRLEALALVYPGLLLSLLAHELGHAWAGQRCGLVVRRILLQAEGGVAEMEGVLTRRTDLWVTLAGPLANLALAAFFLAALMLWPEPPLVQPEGFHRPVPSRPGPMPLALAWLGWGNFLFSFANLLPAFPLDGGRLAMLALAPRLGAARAARWVARSGLFLAGVMVLGFVVSLAGGVPLWLPPGFGPNRAALRAAQTEKNPQLVE
ncbi:M50 family metallopeptidase [Roseomonas sp. 18066]|uniref:M50 family metallopeptidase n=1 Tax=Roseomonas sp. 18066 TaxID=2681412 RepID=UPI00135A6EF1|nr:M50 family metallopeptidase [Roseomonas sp. 18066]